MPLLDSALYILAAFTFGVIFGALVRGLARAMFSIILAIVFLALLISLFNEESLSPIIAAIVGFVMLVFAFLIRRVSFTKAVK